MRALVLTVGLVLAATAGAASQDTAFSMYPAEPSLDGAPAQPQMVLRKARRYRTVLRTAASQGPNFNGHYHVVKWGCGTNCIEWAVINLADGRVWFAPDPAFSCWAPAEPRGLEWPDWFETRIDSRLFYLYECVPGLDGERTFNKRHVYEWRGDRPVLLRTDPFLPRGDAR